MPGLLINAKFDLVTTEYSQNLLGNRLIVTPVITGLPGQFINIGTKESDLKSPMHERDRSSNWRMIVILPSEFTDIEGLYLKLTHRKHPVTNGFAALTTPELYKIDFVSEHFATSQEHTLYLSSAGKS